MFRKEKVIANISWSVFSKISRQVLQLGIIFILSRILGPVEFGLMSMITSFSMLAEIIRNMGMGAAVIQQKNETSELLNTAFCFNLIIGAAVFLIFFFSAPLIASFFNQPVLTDLIRVFSIVYLIGSLNIVQEALLQKRMEFRRLFYMDVVSVITSGALAIFMAMNGWGVWSLVVQYISMIVVSTVILWITSAWKPGIQFDTATFRQLKKYSFNLFAHDVIYFFGRDTDKFLIGKYLGPATLGLYYRAFLLMLLPVNQINIVITRVMFPVMSALQDNIPEMKRVYLRATHMISFVSFPALALLFIIAEPLIILLLGSKWLGVVLYLRLFCIYGMLESVGTTIYWIYKSLGRTDIMLRWGIISTLLIVAAVIGGLWWNGATGIAISYVSVQLVILWIPGWMMAFRLIDMNVITMLKNIGPNFFNSLLAVPLAWWVYSMLRFSIPGITLIIVVSLIYGLVYLILSFVTRQDGLFFALDFIRRRRLRQPV